MEGYKKIKALGTEIEFYLQSDLLQDKDFNLDFDELEVIVSNFEKSFSRFLSDSELSLLNKTPKQFKASPELLKILLLAKNFYQVTNGIFDPTILVALENYGYDKSFNISDFSKEQNNSISKIERIDFSQVNIDLENNLVSRPADLKIDLGGIGKGYLVDVLVNWLKSKAYKNFWISAGGDMYLSGLNESKQVFQVGVQNPKQLDLDLFNISIINQELAVATSGIAKRNWRFNDKIVNHIIDPRTKASVSNNLLAVTVVSDQVIKADIYAKTVLILGKELGLDFINQQENTEALIIDDKLEISYSNNMAKYLIKS